MSQLTLKVKKVNQVNPKTKEMGYAARVVTNGTETFDDLVEYASHNTSLHRVEVSSAAQLILEAASRALKNGKIVDLGPLGRIRPSVLSKWVKDPKTLTKSDLSKSLIYTPSTDIEGAIQSARLAWTNAADEEEDDGDGGTTIVDGGSEGDGNGGSSQNGGTSQGGNTQNGGSSQQTTTGYTLTIGRSGSGTAVVTHNGNALTSGTKLQEDDEVEIAITPAEGHTPTATINGSEIELTENDGVYTGSFAMPAQASALVCYTGSTGGDGGQDLDKD